ncbi:hypothetical protein TrST_g5133 [Triparma strigata]|uniref:Lysophospholipid acyltransferase n=1 Tax=Triparma strigata TaxID=1606541 RepID=A0A9W7B3C6_9STRA|nr:hypothetical protein TrST_g5133 [Triparma strigata]
MEAVLPAGAIPVIKGSIDFIYSLKPYAEPTVCLVPAVFKAQVAALADQIGFDYDTLSYTLGLLLCYPLGMVMAALPYGKTKHLFSFLLGAFLLQFTLGVQWIHQLIASLTAYFLFLVLPRKVTKTVVPTFIVLYCVLGHLHRQFVNYLGWDLDFTGPHMVLTIKLYSIAWNLYDGECLAKGGKVSRATEKCSRFALKEMPSLLEFLGYTFCFSNVLAGPAYEFSIYKAAADGSLLYDSDGKPKGKIPSQIWPTLKALLISLTCMVLFVVGTGKFPILDPTDPQNNDPVFIAAGSGVSLVDGAPWHKRYAYQWLALFCVRFKYYFAWKNAEGANNIWYAGFEGFNDKGEAIGWENANNIDIFEFETAPNLKILSAAWNKKTSNWLTRYIYMRTGGSLAATYAMSAFWHGFYPGYYFFFLSMPLLTSCERIGRKKLSPRFSTGGKWSPWGITTIITTSFLIEYFIQPFQVLSWEWSVAVWSSHSYFGHILAVSFYVFCTLLPTPPSDKKKKA